MTRLRRQLLVVTAVLAALAGPAPEAAWALAPGAGPEDAGAAYRPGELLVMVRHDAVAGVEGPGAAPPRARVIPGSLTDGLMAQGATRWRPALRRGSGRACEAPGPKRAQRVVERAARRGRPLPATLPHLDDLFLVEFASAVDVRAAARALSVHPDVVYAEPNWIFRIQATPLPDVGFIPDDRFVSSDGVHWSEGAFAQAFPDLWGVERVRALEAWNEFDDDGSGEFEADERRPGEGTVVAVIDTGIDAAHPDIDGGVFVNPYEIPGNGVDDDANGFVDDVSGWDFVNGDNDPHDGNGHGSHVAGTIAARADNQLGLVGIAPWASILPVKGLSDSGVGNALRLAAAIRYAAEMGADVLSNSWGGAVSSQLIADAFAYADGLGAVAVASAGNAGADTAAFTPAALDPVIAVAALAPDGARAGFSNYGFATDLAAPGTDVLSLNANGGDNQIARLHPERIVEDDYLVLNGTSMACPHVAGAAALVLSRFPEAGPAEVRGRMLAGAAPSTAANPDAYPLLGRGRLDAWSSLRVSPQPVYQLRGVDAGAILPGSEFEIVVRIVNRWVAAAGVVATLASPDPRAVVLEGTALIGDVATGADASNGDSPFLVSLDETVPFGTRFFFELTLESAGGEIDTIPFSLVVSFFQDVARPSGLPISDVIPTHVSVEDYDGDGAADARVIDPLRVHFYRNVGGGSFEDAQASAGVFYPGIGQSHSVLFDFDGDGDRDMFTGGVLESSLHEQRLPGRFVNVTPASGLRELRSVAAASFDWDGDGRLDLVGGQLSGGLYLMRNGGDGTFTDFAARACLPTSGSLASGGILTFDSDGDGDMDLLVGAQARSLRLYRNEGDGTFTDVTRDAGLSLGRNDDEACRIHGRSTAGRRCPLNPATGFASGDVDNDGDLDLFVSRGAFAEAPRIALFTNDGDGGFSDASADAGDAFAIDLYGLSWGNAFFDLDNDGDLDLLATSDRGTGGLAHQVYRNDGDGRWERVSELAFDPLSQPLGAVVAVGDWDDDGALDFYTPRDTISAGSRGCVCANRVARSGHWIAVALAGVVSPGDPYGARVYVTADGVTQLREMHTSAVEPQSLHFGLGDAVRADVEIHWPSGLVQLLRDQLVDRELRIEEPAHCLGAGGPDCTDVRLGRALREPLDLEAIPACPDHGRPDDQPPPGSKAQGPRK